ncbi:MAG: TIGR03087 family PEP-CTERM/XrtA system glycosyltransferase [Planctomycetota bacterium]
MRSRPRVLLLTHRVPCPPDRGDRIRSHHLLGWLGEHADVTLACPTDEPLTDPQHHALAAMTKGLLVERDDRAARFRRLAAARLRGRPLTPANFYLPRLAERVAELHRRDPLDSVVCFCTGMHGYVERLLEIDAPRPRLVLDMVDIDSAKWARLADRPAGRSPLATARRWVHGYEARRLGELERNAARVYDAVSLVNRAEAEAYRRSAVPADARYRLGKRFAEVVHATNGVDLDRYAPTPVPRGSRVVLFTGVLDYAPNIEGVEWFARRCLPTLRGDVPGATFRVVGKRPSAAVRRLATLPGVEIVGEVPDTRPHLREAAIVVAPLRVAPGVQNKVLEAMAAARPVVATPQAVSGIDAEPGRHLLAADHPTRFALLCAHLLNEPRQARQIAHAARRQVEAAHRWDAALRPLIDRIVGPPATPMTPALRRAA